MASVVIKSLGLLETALLFLGLLLLLLHRFWSLGLLSPGYGYVR